MGNSGAGLVALAQIHGGGISTTLLLLDSRPYRCGDWKNPLAGAG